MRVHPAVACIALLGCTQDGPIPCLDSSVCTIEAGGQCIASPLGIDLCAYPADKAVCPSGTSWSPQAGDMLANQCLGADGRWSVSWSCFTGCAYPTPTIAKADLLVVADATLTWRSSTDAAIQVGHVGGVDQNCVNVPGAVEGGGERQAYRFCAVDNAFRIEIGVTFGPDLARWEAAAVRR